VCKAKMETTKAKLRDAYRRLKRDCGIMRRSTARKEAGGGERQQGFSMLAVLIAVLIVGTMATVAVPRFNAALATANTTKIKADLSAIDTAIALYSIDKGKEPDTMDNLKDYLEDYQNIKPPTGKCNVKGAVTDVPGTAYSISKEKSERMQAHLGENTVYDFGNGK